MLVEMGRGKFPEKKETHLRLTVGNNVKLSRENAGLSQRDLCELTNISQSYLSQVESGRWNLGIDNIAKIASAVGVEPHHLLDPDFLTKRYSRSRS
jgi:transcriptional regulator with XRE-family HTH domain